jgi:CBS domain-containing protein
VSNACPRSDGEDHLHRDAHRHGGLHRTNDENDDCGFIPITDAGRLVGVVTDRDIVIRCLADARTDVRDERIDRVMSTSVWTIDADATVEEAAHVMAEHEVRRLPAMSKGSLVGGLSYGNLEQAVHAEGPAAAEATLGVTRGA